MKKIIITIDGHSACGKSTLAKHLAEKLKYGYIDTGAMYRAVTYYFLENRVNVQKTREVDAALEKINIHFKSTVGGNRTFLNGADVEDAIRKMFVSKSVSHVAAMSKVRKKVVKQQQEMGKQKGIVMEGRDIGTVVFPKAELKMFLTADEDVRTQRRFDELKAKGQKVSAKAIKKNLKERDHLDSTRKDSPLKQAKEAVLIDNSNLTQKEQLAMALALANERIAAINKVTKKVAKKPANQKSPQPSSSKPQKLNSKKSAEQKNSSNQTRSKNKKSQESKSSNNKNTNNRKPKSKPAQPERKPVERKTRPARQKTNQQKRTKPQPKQTNKTKPNSSKPRTNKKQNKPQPKKAKTQSTNRKSNNTSTKRTSPKPQPRRKPNKPQPKRNVKPKPDLELDDFSF